MSQNFTSGWMRSSKETWWLKYDLNKFWVINYLWNKSFMWIQFLCPIQMIQRKRYKYEYPFKFVHGNPA